MKRLFTLMAVAAAVMTIVASPAEARKYRVASQEGVQMLPHPAGCMRIKFCGCGARKHLGIDDKRLDLAANWPKFYRGSSQVAVWRGHVAVIDRWTGPHTAMMYDYNSGGHRSRYHERDTRGAKIIGGSAFSQGPASHRSMEVLN